MKRIATVSFIQAFAAGMTLFTAPLIFAQDMLQGRSMLGLLGGTFAAVYVLMCLSFRALSRRFGIRTLALLGLGINGCLLVILALAREPLFFLSIFALRAASIALFWPAVEAEIGAPDKAHRLPENTGLFNISWSVGFGVAPLFGLLFWQTLGHRWPLFVAALCSFALAPFFRKSVTSGVSAAIERAPAETSPRQRLFILVSWIASFLIFFSISTIRYIFPELKMNLGISDTSWAFLLFALSIPQVVTFWIMSRWKGWHFRFAPIVVAQVLFALVLLVIILSEVTLVFFLAFAFAGIAVGITFSASLYYSLLEHRDHQVRTGFLEGVVGAGSVFGPIISGSLTGLVLGEVVKAPYLVSLAVLLTGLAIEIGIISKWKSRGGS